MTQLTSEEFQELVRNVTSTKRKSRIASGRSLRRSYNSQQTLRAVGGYANVTQAIFAPPDQEMCVVVTREVGWCKNADGTSTATPFRSPQQTRSLSGRGV